MALGPLGRLIFDEYVRKDGPWDEEELEWLIKELLKLARQYPEHDDCTLVRAVNDEVSLGPPKPRYTIEDIRALATWHLDILRQTWAKSPDIRHRPLERSEWYKLAQITDRAMRMVLAGRKEEANV